MEPRPLVIFGSQLVLPGGKITIYKCNTVQHSKHYATHFNTGNTVDYYTIKCNIYQYRAEQQCNIGIYIYCFTRQYSSEFMLQK